jgi:hypothetical protein
MLGSTPKRLAAFAVTTTSFRLFLTFGEPKLVALSDLAANFLSSFSCFFSFLFSLSEICIQCLRRLSDDLALNDDSLLSMPTGTAGVGVGVVIIVSSSGGA